MKNIKVNAFANILVRIMNIVFPLVTAPYLARVLSTTDYGYFNVANTFVGMFIPFATLGVYNYGIRQISNVKDNKQEVNKIFSQLFYLSVFCSIATTLVYLCVVSFIDSPAILRTLYYIMAIQIASQCLYIEWMNEAFENYTFILYKTFIIRVGMLISLFVFVRTEHDIIPYALIMSLVVLLNYSISFLWIKREVQFIRVNIKDIYALLKPLIALLLLANAGMLYTYLDRLFISAGGVPEYSSYYYISQSIILSICGVISGAVSVSIPRLGYYLGRREENNYKALVYKGGRIFMFCIVPISMGLVIVGPQTILLYAGEKYIAAGAGSIIFAIRAIPWALALLLENQVIFVKGYENQLTLFYFIGGGINLLLNSLLFFNGILKPEYYILTTLLSELCVLGLDIYFITKNQLIDVRPIFKHTLTYFIYTIGFFPIAFLMRRMFTYGEVVNFMLVKNIAANVLLCVAYYCIVLMVRKDEVFYEAWETVREKIKKPFKK